jgi:hypothetical protein
VRVEYCAVLRPTDSIPQTLSPDSGGPSNSATFFAQRNA